MHWPSPLLESEHGCEWVTVVSLWELHLSEQLSFDPASVFLLLWIPLAADAIDLINKDDCLAFTLPGMHEEASYQLLALSHPAGDEVRAGDTVEGRLYLTTNSWGKESDNNISFVQLCIRVMEFSFAVPDSLHVTQNVIICNVSVQSGPYSGYIFTSLTFLPILMSML